MKRVTIAAVAGTCLLLSLAAMPREAASGKQGSVKGKVTIKKDGKKQKSAANVVITIEDVPGGDPKPSKKRVIRQRNKQFTPFLTVVTEGTKVEFPNDDKIHHNVFSVSRPKRFDLGLYKAGTSKDVVFKRDGVVDVYCNIHPEMVAKVKVVDTRYYAVTEKNGTFRIDNIPSGKYPIVAWQPYGEEYRGTVTVESGKTATVKFELEAEDKPRRHMRKDGTPYGRYK